MLSSNYRFIFGMCDVYQCCFRISSCQSQWVSAINLVKLVIRTKLVGKGILEDCKPYHISLCQLTVSWICKKHEQASRY